MNKFGVGNTVTNVFQPTVGVSNPTKTGMVFASRRLGANKAIIPASNGQAYPSPYIPFRLSAFKNGAAAASSLQSMGFNYVQGYSVSQTLSAPDLVTTDTVTGLTSLIWNNTTTGLEQITGTIASGSVTQTATSASATIRTVDVGQTTTTLVVTMTSGSPDFNTTGQVLIVANIATQAPNPKLSDEVVVFAYWYFQKYAISPVYTTSPDLWVSVLIDGVNTDISAQGAPVDLVTPMAVDILADDSVNLTYAVGDDNLGLLPNTYFGLSTVTQATSGATGTFNGFTISNASVVINVTNVTGTFDTTDTVSVQLDTSLNGGLLTDQTEIGGYAMCYPVANQTQLANYGAFEALIALKRAPDEVKNNQFNVQGYYGYTPSYIAQHPISFYQQASNAGYVSTIKLDVNTAYQYPCSNVMLVAQSMFTDMNNEPPFFADVGDGALLNIVASSNKASYPNDDVLDQLVAQGNTAIGVNSQGIAYWYQRVCALQTLSGTTDYEFRYQALQLKKRWLDRNIELQNRAATIDPNTGQRVNNTPLVLKSVAIRGTNVVTAGVEAGICGTIGNNVTAVLNPTDPTRILETVTTSLTAQNNGVDAVVYINSYVG